MLSRRKSKARITGHPHVSVFEHTVDEAGIGTSLPEEKLAGFLPLLALI